MSNEIDDYAKACQACQRHNQQLTKTPATLHSIAVDSPWHTVGIDLIGPLPKTASGNAHSPTTSQK